MLQRLFLFCFLFAMASQATYGQVLDPLTLAKKLFGKDSLPSIEKHFTGEFDGHPNGSDLQEGSRTAFLLLNQTDTTAVVAITIADSLGVGLDTYLHFEKDSIWKINAFRALAMTGIIAEVKKELEKLTPEQVTQVIQKCKSKKGKENAFFTTREEYEFQLGNTRLTLELDANIIAHFLRNKHVFDAIKDSALAEVQNLPTNKDKSYRVGQRYKPQYQKLFIHSITFEDNGFENSLSFLIGGMLDNAVGFLYVPDKRDLPTMRPNRLIMLREIGDGWYLYKTT